MLQNLNLTNPAPEPAPERFWVVLEGMFHVKHCSACVRILAQKKEADYSASAGASSTSLSSSASPASVRV